MRTARRFDAMNDICYSYTDRQVESTVKYSIIIGIIVGSVLTATFLNILK